MSIDGSLRVSVCIFEVDFEQARFKSFHDSFKGCINPKVGVHPPCGGIKNLCKLVLVARGWFPCNDCSDCG